MQLNHAQKEAVAHKEGPCMVLAGPGSGKTLTIAKRIEYLIMDYKVRPEEILVLTFTKYAAKSMKQRFAKVMKQQASAVTFGTFHGVYYGILKWAYRLTSANLLTEEERKNLLTGIVSKTDWGEDEELLREEDFLKNLSEEIGNVKNHRYNIETYEAKQYGENRFRDIYTAYEKEKKRLHKLDFEDMLLECSRLFESRPDILAKWQKRFPYILVDEFQDINRVQYDVLRMLAGENANLFVVGDDDQSIYGFRGASPGIMQQFMKDYPQAKQILLDVNYRSTAHIVNGALRVITNNKNRFLKKIKAEQKADLTVHVQEVRDPFEESRYILGRIRETLKSGIQYEEIAILYRTAAEARVMAETLMEHQIPFQMKEHLYNIYEHFIGQDIKSYLHLAEGIVTRKDLLRIANRPNRYISRDSMRSDRADYESLRKYYQNKKWMQDRIDQLEWDMKMIAGKSPYAVIQYIRKRVGYDAFLKEYAAYRRLCTEELFEVLDEIQERAKAYATIPEWFAHIEQYEENLWENSRKTQKEGICMLTMHGAKGLEYDTVFILGANEGSMPYRRAVMQDETEEERRLFYVAMTRAKRQLVISYVKEKNGKDCSPSRFVKELFL